jgi:hypothetical protein
MATWQPPMVTTEFVDLVETMRKAQQNYDKLFHDRDAHPTQHQIRRAEQDRKAAEQKVDVWLVSYRIDAKKYAQAFEPKETNELPGFYKTASE